MQFCDNKHYENLDWVISQKKEPVAYLVMNVEEKL